ncbi:MAG: hypothetical protein M0Z65_08150 [Firmicutes bacterium]|nr:hypothetical protein [Bacillota bacterium]
MSLAMSSVSRTFTITVTIPKGWVPSSLTSGGSWTRYPNAAPYSGNSPVHPDAWSKIFIGLEKANLDEGIQNLHPATFRHRSRVVKLMVPGSKGSEYFLIENRQPVSGTFDMGLTRYGDVKGLAIYHVDETVMERNFWRPNEAQYWYQSRKQGAKPDPNKPTTASPSCKQTTNGI